MANLRMDILRRRFGLPPLATAPMAGESPPMARGVARVPTDKGSRYLQQLCKHWSHTLTVTFTEDSGRVTFPAKGRNGSWPGEAILTLEATSDSLACILEGSVPEQVEALKDVVARHLDRFAFREAPLTFNWIDG
jgi:hypothetical protein